MATAAITNEFTNATVADADEVNTNFSDLVTFLNDNVVHRDGSKAMTDNLDMGSKKIVSLATPTSNSDGATKAYVDGQRGGARLTREDAAQLANLVPTKLTFVPGQDFDEGDYYASSSHQFVVPAGMGGLHLVTFNAVVRHSSGSSGALANFYFGINGATQRGSIEGLHLTDDVSTQGYPVALAAVFDLDVGDIVTVLGAKQGDSATWEDAQFSIGRL